MQIMHAAGVDYFQTFFHCWLNENIADNTENASGNAATLVDGLTLIYNKARQGAITSEILDIVGGAEALQATLDKATDQILADSAAAALAAAR